MCSLETLRLHTDRLRRDLIVAQAEDDRILSMFVDGHYTCPVNPCKKQYKTKTGFIKHLSNVHPSFKLHDRPDVTDDVLSVCKNDSMILLLFLLRDLTDAYRMGDGDRAFRDIKVAFLYFFSTGHVKYRLWLFRMLAYDMSLLSPRKAFEYRWNVSTNINGGIEGNIPDHNLVEINVKMLRAFTCTRTKCIIHIC